MKDKLQYAIEKMKTHIEKETYLFSEDLYKIEGVSSVFFGPGFITITKVEDVEWESINQDIINIFDKL